MSTPMHIIMGITLATVIPPISHSIDPQTRLWIAVLGANIPDFDVLYCLPKHKDHRSYSITHIPLFWFFIGISTYPFLSRTSFGLEIFCLLSVGIVSHFILDMAHPGNGIRLFAPFSLKKYSIFRLIDEPFSIKSIIRTYAKQTIRYEMTLATACAGIISVLSRIHH